MINIQTFIFICSFLFLSCSKEHNKSNTDIAIYEINLDSLEVKEVEKMSSYFKSVKLIPLETSDNNLIETVDAIQVIDDYIFILDKSYKRLYCFDKDGKYIRRIGSVGSGPGEYSSISDFTIDNEGIIYILDRSDYKILLYTISGEYKHSISFENIDGNSGHIQHYKNFLYLDFQPNNINSKEENPLLIKIDKVSGKLLGKYLSSEMNNLGFELIIFKVGSYFYSRSDNTPYYAPIYSNTVFSLKDSIKPYFTIKSNRLLEKDDIKHLNLSQPFVIVDINRIDKINSILNFQEIGDVIFCEYSDGHKFKTLVYSKVKGEGVIIDNLYDDYIYKNSNDALMHYYGCSVEKGLYSYINVFDVPYLVDYYKSGKLNIKLDVSQENMFINNVTEESNPILLFYEFY